MSPFSAHETLSKQDPRTVIWGLLGRHPISWISPRPAKFLGLHRDLGLTSPSVLLPWPADTTAGFCPTLILFPCWSPSSLCSRTWPDRSVPLALPVSLWHMRVHCWESLGWAHAQCQHIAGIISQFLFGAQKSHQLAKGFQGYALEKLHCVSLANNSYSHQKVRGGGPYFIGKLLWYFWESRQRWGPCGVSREGAEGACSPPTQAELLSFMKTESVFSFITSTIQQPLPNECLKCRT